MEQPAPRKAVEQPLTYLFFHIQDVTVTNDGATILSLLDIEHPAGKILVDLAQQQDKEVRRSHTNITLVVLANFFLLVRLETVQPQSF